jgi:aspartate aminotransferase-like enzyme
MFGPNARTSIRVDIDYHHREEKFFSIYENILRRLRSIFRIDDSFEIVIVTGSGTATMETVLSSYRGTFRVGGAEGTFRNRWIELAKHYHKLDDRGDLIIVQLETSKSILNDAGDEEPFFVDGISSFPYYDIPPQAKIFVTVSSKILGAAPVLGIVIFKKSLVDRFIPADDFTYFNVNRLLIYGRERQTPHTPAIPLFADLLAKLERFDLPKTRARIDHHSEILVDAFGEENFIGQRRCPVLTLRDPDMLPPWILEKYSIYGYRPLGKAKKNLQIFTYSEKTRWYEHLARDLKKIRF